jgi:hypothetical protein
MSFWGKISDTIECTPQINPEQIIPYHIFFTLKKVGKIKLPHTNKAVKI